MLTMTLSAAPVAAQNWALGGLDPVSIVVEGKAVEGRADVTTHWKGVIWHFISEEHRALFEANPRAYLPAFNGICPVSLSEGRPAPGEPRIFAVIEGKLFLLRSDEARVLFLADPATIIAKAKDSAGKAP